MNLIVGWDEGARWALRASGSAGPGGIRSGWDKAAKRANEVCKFYVKTRFANRTRPSR